MNVKNRQCEHAGCARQPSFAPPGSPPARCAQHKAIGDEDVKNRRCEHAGCVRRPSFAPPGSRSARCAQHKAPGDESTVKERKR